MLVTARWPEQCDIRWLLTLACENVCYEVRVSQLIYYSLLIFRFQIYDLKRWIVLLSLIIAIKALRK